MYASWVGVFWYRHIRELPTKYLGSCVFRCGSGLGGACFWLVPCLVGATHCSFTSAVLVTQKADKIGHVQADPTPYIYSAVLFT